MAALGTPVIYGMADALAGQDFGEAIGGAAMLPRSGAGDEVNVAGSELLVIPGIGEIAEIVDGIVEIEIVVVHAVHEIPEVVDAGHGEAALENIGVFEERVCSVICAEGGTHGGDSDLGLTIVPDERNDFLPEIGIKDRLHVAAMKRMCSFVIKAQAVDGIDRVDLHAAGINEIRQRADHTLAFEFPFVSGAGGEAEKGRSPVAVGDHPEFEAETR